jgi:hypothetical protein
VALTFLDLQDEVLHDEFDPGKYRTLVKRWLNIALGKVARALDLPAVQTTGTPLALSAGTAAYAFPEMIEVIHSIVIDGRVLIQADIDDLDEYDDDSRGTPTHYALFGNEITFWPAPDAAVSPTFRYTGRATALSADGDLLPIDDDNADVLVNFAKSKAFAAEDDPEMASYFLTLHREGLREMRAQSERTRGNVRQIQGMMLGHSGPRFQRPG